jgi:hypothetical protein
LGDLDQANHGRRAFILARIAGDDRTGHQGRLSVARQQQGITRGAALWQHVCEIAGGARFAWVALVSFVALLADAGGALGPFVAAVALGARQAFRDQPAGPVNLDGYLYAFFCETSEQGHD